MAKMPYCPVGYEWVRKAGPHCYKVTNAKGTKIRDDTSLPDLSYDEPTFNKYCVSEGTRLASPMTDEEIKAIKSFSGTHKYDEQVDILLWNFAVICKLNIFFSFISSTL